MEPRRGETFISPTEETVPLEAESRLPPPRFDKKSVQRAQPAVPIARRARAGSWPSALVVLCVLGGVAGGVLGGLALTFYQRDGSNAERRAAQDGAQGPGGAAAIPAAATEPGANAPGELKPADGAGETPAASTARPDAGAQPAEAEARVSEEPSAASPADAGTEGELRAALGEWVAATNSRDVGRQMSYYAPKVDAFYLSRNTPREAVRAEKSRLFSRAASVNVEAAPPDIRVSRDGRTAVMRFRKRYQITGGDGARSGEVLQELRWRRTAGGWKIVGERDLRVIQ